MTSRFYIQLLLVCSLILGGCSGNKVKKLDDRLTELPDEVPKEFKDKFEIADVTETEAPKAVDKPQVESKGTSTKPVLQDTTKKNEQKEQKTVSEETETPETEVKTAEVQKSEEKRPDEKKFPMRRPAVDPIWPGEQHVFEITYFGVLAGTFTLDMMGYKKVNGRKVYHIQGRAKSSRFFSLFYRLDDLVETFIDYDGFFSHRFHLILDESKQTRNALELYDSEKKETFYWNRWNHYKKGYTETKELKPIPPYPQDSLSSLYYIRFLPMKDGAVLTFPVVSEGNSWDAVVTVVRREMMDTPIGKVRAIVVKPQAKFRGVLTQSGDSFIWLTDDDRRLVLKVEAKVRIGSVVAYLKEVKLGTPPGGGGR